MNFNPSELIGTMKSPPSKSAAHRALILAYLSGGAEVAPIALSNDIIATIGCLKALGAEVTFENNVVKVVRCELPEKAVFELNESGSTMRFFLPLTLALGVNAEFRGEGQLPSRPYQTFADQLIQNGAQFSATEGLPVTVFGKLCGGDFVLPGNISSQFVTGLLLVLPTLKEDSRVILTSKLESKGYVDMTLKMLCDCKIKIEETQNGYFILGNQTYKAKTIKVEGDYSNAAFFLAAAALNGNVTISGLDPSSLQGDRTILNILFKMGARIVMFENRIQVKQSKLKSIDIDVSQIPDLAPVLSCLLAAGDGVGRLKNAARLRLKECDRFEAIIENLNRAKVNAYAEGDDIVIHGGYIAGGDLLGYNDHRMVMAAAVLGLVAPITVTDCHAIKKSYPDFFDVYRALGGKAEEGDNTI